MAKLTVEEMREILKPYVSMMVEEVADMNFHPYGMYQKDTY